MSLVVGLANWIALVAPSPLRTRLTPQLKFGKMTNLPSILSLKRGRAVGVVGGGVWCWCWGEGRTANGASFGFSCAADMRRDAMRCDARRATREACSMLWGRCQMRCLLLGWHNEIPTFDLLTTTTTTRKGTTQRALFFLSLSLSLFLALCLSLSEFICCCFCCGCLRRRRCDYCHIFSIFMNISLAKRNKRNTSSKLGMFKLRPVRIFTNTF